MKPTPAAQATASLKSTLIIKGGKVVNHDYAFMADVYIEDGLIKDVGQNLITPSGVRTIDATGKLVIPGGIDTSTYFEYFTSGTRTADDFYTGTKAALSGGTTTIMNHIIENSSTTSLLEAFDLNKSRAEQKSCCDYGFHVSLFKYDQTVAKEMESLVNEKKINSFKAYMAPLNESHMMSDEDLINVLEKCKQLGAIGLVHAENGLLINKKIKEIKELGITGPEGHMLSRPEELEAEATKRVICIANQVNCPLYISPVMSKSSALIISNAKRSGSVVFGEPTAASLSTDGTHYFNKCWRHSAGHVMSPPLRDDPTTPGYLMDFLANGDLELSSSAHCVFNTNQKALGKNDFSLIPAGINGVEDRMTVIWDKGVHSGKMDPSKFVAVTSTNAAKIFNMYPRKGLIAKGSDADIVIWDPEATKTISSDSHNQSVDFNVFEGFLCHGLPLTVVYNGNVVYENQTLNATQGSGRFIETACFSDYVYKRVLVKDVIKAAKVDREEYTGPVVDLTKSIEVSLAEAKLNVGKQPLQPSQAADFHHRTTKSGVRHMQDSSFSFGGNQWDDQAIKSGIRVRNPPGGKSSGIF